MRGENEDGDVVVSSGIRKILVVVRVVLVCRDWFALVTQEAGYAVKRTPTNKSIRLHDIVFGHQPIDYMCETPCFVFQDFGLFFS